MKQLFVILLLSGSASIALADAPTTGARTEATVALNCDHKVAGTSCPAKYAAACTTLFCESKPAEKTSTQAPSETDK